MTDENNTKLLRIESAVDRVLAFAIQLPAPGTTVFIVVWLGLTFAAGWFVRGLF